jgi:phage tail tube protein FII
MAQATIYVMESANLICGDTRSAVPGGVSAPGISTHLTLQELKLPAMEENYVDHAPGGAPIAIEVPTHMNKLEATFNLAGWDPGLMAYIGQNDPYYQRFTAYGLIRDRRTSKALQAMAVIEGRLGRVNPTAFSKGNLMAHEYSIKSIVHYKLTMQLTENGQTPFEIYHWDFFTSKRRIGGKDLNRDMINLLRIPTGSADRGVGGPISPAEAGGIIT